MNALTMSAEVEVALKFGLELLKRGAMLVHSDAKPYVVNRAASEILNRKDGLSLSATGIRADSASDTRLLISLLREAIAFPQNGEPKDSPICISRKMGTALVVRVVPGPELSQWPRTDARTALVTISDPVMAPAVSEPELIRLYGLTRGEAAVASQVIRGKSIEEAAEGLFISAHTARTHLKRIFLKTETHRQSELVVRLLSTVL